MMALKGDIEKIKSNSSLDSKRKYLSKTSFESQNDETPTVKRPKAASGVKNTKPKKNIQVRPKTAGDTDTSNSPISSNISPVISNNEPPKKVNKIQSDNSLNKKKPETDLESTKSEFSPNRNTEKGGINEILQTSDSKVSTQKKISDSSDMSTENGLPKAVKFMKISSKKPSEIPKLKSLKNATAMPSKKINSPSKLPVKTILKEAESKSQDVENTITNKITPSKLEPKIDDVGNFGMNKLSFTKTEMKIEEKENPINTSKISTKNSEGKIDDVKSKTTLQKTEPKTEGAGCSENSKTSLGKPDAKTENIGTTGFNKTPSNRQVPLKTAMKNLRERKDARFEEKIKETTAEDFSTLIPFYETELKKMTEVWVNTIYCSLTMRTNLVKLLFQAYPYIDRSQFQTEDEKLLHCIAHAKNYTKSETDSLVHFIRSLVANRDKIKEQHSILQANKELSEAYGNDWRKITRKIAEVGEETKQIQLDLQKKKDGSDTMKREKIKLMEANLINKEEEIQKLEAQLEVLKKKEANYKGNILLKVHDYKDIRNDIQSLMNVEKEYDELKLKNRFQNETYEKKVKDLEFLLEEKKKTLEKEKEKKEQMRGYLTHLKDQEQKLEKIVGKEQMDFIMGRPLIDKDKRREQLWMASVKLILKGFFFQMKQLERDKNKMLLELQASDAENFNAVATQIIRKDNFIKSIKLQMKSLQKASKCFNTKSEENTDTENVISN